MLVMGLNSFFQGRAVRDYQSGGTARLVKSLSVSLAVFLSGLGTISLLFWFAGAWLLGLLYDPRFSDLADVVFWLSINTLLVSVTMVAANGMAALGKSMGYVWG